MTDAARTRHLQVAGSPADQDGDWCSDRRGGDDRDMALAAHKLTKRFGSGESAVTAVDRASLHLERGEVVLLQGPSGSGKTTLVSMLAGLLAPSAGTVMVSGIVIDEHRRRAPQWRLERIGFVFQSFNLLPNLTTLENVALPLRLAGTARQTATDRARDLLRQLGLDSKSDVYPGSLSGGERQRTSIARALVVHPAVVLADEPTANLDTHQGQIVAEVLTALARQDGRACLVVSHDPRLRTYVDRILTIEDGRLTQ